MGKLIKKIKSQIRLSAKLVFFYFIFIIIIEVYNHSQKRKKKEKKANNEVYPTTTIRFFLILPSILLHDAHVLLMHQW